MIRILVYSLLLIVATVQSGYAITIKSGTPYQFLKTSEVSVLATDEDLSISDVLKISQDRFSIQKGAVPFIQDPSKTYWLKFSLCVDSLNDAEQWVLENYDFHIDHFEFWYPEKGTYKKQEAGYSKLFNARLFKHKNFVFPLSLNLEEKTFYIKAKSNIHNPFYLKIHTSANLVQYSNTEYYFLGLFYGLLVIMAVYNLMLFWQVREWYYIYYVVYLALNMLFALEEDGTGFEYLWPLFPWINEVIDELFPLLIVGNFYLYALHFLDLKTFASKINKVTQIVLALCFLFFFADLFFIQLRWGVVLYTIPFLLIYIASWVALKNGSKGAIYFLSAYTFMIIALILLMLRMSGLMHTSNLLVLYSYNISLVIEALVFSFAMAERIRLSKMEKEKAQEIAIEQLEENQRLKDSLNQELEQKVKERTLELEKQSAIIQELNRQLQFQNTQLKDDVKVITKSRVTQQTVSYEEFCKIYPNEEACMRYLSEIKWKSDFKCKKCGYDFFSQGKTLYSRRCTKCGYDESVTVDTLFHRLKFPMTKAFYIAHLVINRKNFSVDDIATRLELRRQTCLEFKRKTEEVVKTKKVPKNLQDDWGSFLVEVRE